MTERAQKVLNNISYDFLTWCHKRNLSQSFQVDTLFDIDWEKLGVGSCLGKRVEVTWIDDVVISAQYGLREISLVLRDNPSKYITRSGGYRFTFNSSQLSSKSFDIHEEPKSIPKAEIEQSASIDSFVHDQGGGGSWCSSCHIDIDIEKIQLTMRCPNPECNKPLVWGETDYMRNMGGSDF